LTAYTVAGKFLKEGGFGHPKENGWAHSRGEVKGGKCRAYLLPPTREDLFQFPVHDVP